MRIYAHRGISAHFPENTLAAFRAAVESGVDGIELDIHCSADGVPVVLHDESLERTSSGSGPVNEKTITELALIDAGGGERVPTFEEVVQLVGGRLAFDVEIKSTNCEAAVLDVLSRHMNTRAAISSFDWDILANVRALDPDVEVWVLTDAVTGDAIAAGRQVGATTLAVDYLGIAESSMERARDAGFEVMAWTVNDPKVAERLRDLGVAALCTDDPVAIARSTQGE